MKMQKLCLYFLFKVFTLKLMPVLSDDSHTTFAFQIVDTMRLLKYYSDDWFYLMQVPQPLAELSCDDNWEYYDHLTIYHLSFMASPKASKDITHGHVKYMGFIPSGLSERLF